MSDHFWNLQDERSLFLIAMFSVKSSFNGENPSRSSEHFGDVYLKKLVLFTCVQSLRLGTLVWQIVQWALGMCQKPVCVGLVYGVGINCIVYYCTVVTTCQYCQYVQHGTSVVLWQLTHIHHLSPAQFGQHILWLHTLYFIIKKYFS